MSFSSFLGAALAAGLCLVPAASFAQEVFGDIAASLAGTERTWFLTSNDDSSQSFGMTMAVANLQSFSLWGQPDAESVNVVDDSFLLRFDVMSVGEQLIPLNVSLTYLENGWKSGWVADDPETMDFSLTTLEKSDAGVMVGGNFGATANYREPLADGQPDPARTLQIDGNFTAMLAEPLIKNH